MLRLGRLRPETRFPPQDYYRALGIGLREGPMGRVLGAIQLPWRQGFRLGGPVRPTRCTYVAVSSGQSTYNHDYDYDYVQVGACGSVLFCSVIFSLVL